MKLRVLLVDDEKLVRKSLEALLPWAEYDMEVVGGAATGEEAMLCLRENAVDIVFVDLSMPVMGGFELLHRINMEFPHMVKIVLTCHAEIKYIQRAIEEGISGYILKTDFDMADIRKLMSRVQELAMRNRSKPKLQCLMSGLTQQDYLPYMQTDTEAVWLGERLALLRTEGNLISLLPPGEACTLVSLTDEQAHRLRRDPEAACAVVSRQLFYAKAEENRIFALEALPALSSKDISEMNEQLESGEWLLTADQCKALWARLEATRFPGDLLTNSLRVLMDDLSCAMEDGRLQVLWKEMSRKAVMCWQDAKRVMERMRMTFGERMRANGVSADSAMVILRSLQIIHVPKRLFGKAGDIAAMVGFSRSHFSRCFSQLMGMSYRDYTRMMRLKWIQHKVQQEGMSMAEVAASLDYINAEYFCRIYNIKITDDNKTGGT